jgi:hypothetical protein
MVKPGAYKKNEGDSWTYVFLHDLIETSFERTPWEDFDVLLDAAGPGYRETHDELEKLGHGKSRDGSGPYELEVASVATLIFAWALPVSDVLDESENFHGGVPPFPSSRYFLRLIIHRNQLVVDARDDEEIFGILLWWNTTEGQLDVISNHFTIERNQLSADFLLLLGWVSKVRQWRFCRKDERDWFKIDSRVRFL